MEKLRFESGGGGRSKFDPVVGGAAAEISSSLGGKPSFFLEKFPLIEDLAWDLAKRGDPKISQQNLEFFRRKVSRELGKVQVRNKKNRAAAVASVLRALEN